MRDATKTQRLIEKLKNKTYRDSFVSDHITIGIPFQIKALRKQRGWTQSDLGDTAGMAQTAVSRLENDYEGFTLATLRKLASAFDVGLLIRFVPFSRLIRETANLSPEALAAESFEAELSSGRLSPTASASTQMKSADIVASSFSGEHEQSYWSVYTFSPISPAFRSESTITQLLTESRETRLGGEHYVE